MYTERVVNVNARKQVRRCVSGVKPLAKRCKHIVAVSYTHLDVYKRQVFGLPVSGVVDYNTWYEISNIYVAVTRIAELA